MSRGSWVACPELITCIPVISKEPEPELAWFCLVQADKGFLFYSSPSKIFSKGISERFEKAIQGKLNKNEQE